MDHPCHTDDEKMASIYQSSYLKLGTSYGEYRKLAAAIDSPIGVPVKNEVIGIGIGYRDPLMFRFSTFPKPAIQPCPCVTFDTSK